MQRNGQRENRLNGRITDFFASMFLPQRGFRFGFLSDFGPAFCS